MLVVDTHVHASPHWYEPIESLLYHMSANGVEKATLVQFEGQFDNSYLFECVRRYPGRFAPIVIVDAQRPDAAQTVRDLAKQGAGGLRMRVWARSPGSDPLALWRTCNELGLPLSCNGKESEIASPEFRDLVRGLPDTRIVIEHLGFVDPQEQPPYDTFLKVLALADFPNVYIKVGGISELCNRPKVLQPPFFSQQTIPPFVRMAVEAFGARRVMWSSNYPPVSQKEGYANSLRFLRQHVAGFCSAEDVEWIMGKTAASVFRFV